MHLFAKMPSRLVKIVSAAVLLIAVVGTTSWIAVSQATAANPLSAIPGSLQTVGAAQSQGHHASTTSLTVQFTLHPSHQDQINTLVTNLHDTSSAQYHQWLQKGDFEARFAPSKTEVAALKSFLRGKGLTIAPADSPFVLRATGTTAQVEKALATHVTDYVTPDGTKFFANDQAAFLPASLVGTVSGVAGLSNTSRAKTRYIRTSDAAKQAGVAVPQYGAGPNGSGLTPSQLSSLYSADSVHAAGARGNGAGKTLAVFELSGYNRADITTYEHQFFGPNQNTPLVDVNVDGGPLNPICPPTDTCGPFNAQNQHVNAPDYSGDIEVEADIETQIAMAPAINGILVYNAPNDFLGITIVDEYLQIAHDNFADSISTSWGACELDSGLAQVQAENIAFTQMAAQGQSIFASSGDTGAFGCIRGSGSTAIDVGDPSQPTVTVVGGTSFGTYDPGTDLHPAYPTGFETVWNPLGRCRILATGAPSVYCANFGASGGGVSIFWAAPSWQHGTGVVTPLSQTGKYCGQTAGTLCREVPDVSANADEFTPYSEYCSGVAGTNSACLGGAPWFGIGGTSLSAPLWAGILALHDSYQNERFGQTNHNLYQLFNKSNAYSTYYHDITGKFQTPNNNGYYPVTPGYDMATGIGTPRVSAIAKWDNN